MGLQWLQGDESEQRWHRKIGAKPTNQGHNEQLAVVTDERVSLDEVEEGGKVLQVREIDEEDDKQLLADRKKKEGWAKLGGPS